MNWERYAAAGLLAAACLCSAKTKGSKADGPKVLFTPHGVIWGNRSPKATVPKEMIGSFAIGKMRIVLEDTTLAAAQRRFGGVVGDHGDAGDSLAWLCLYKDTPDARWILWLTSGEMEGLTSIGGFAWRQLAPNEQPDHRCSALPKEGAEVELPIAVHPGMTEQELRNTLGKPSLTRGNVLLYLHEHSVVIRKEPFTVDNSLAVELRNGVVWAIEVERVTAN